MPARVARNAIANAVQMLAGAVLMFALYRYIALGLGVARLGVWSVVIAATSASRLADLGIGAGLTRFVAKALAEFGASNAARVVETGSLALAGAATAVMFLIVPAIYFVLPHVFSSVALQEAESLVPFAAVSLWLTIVSTVATGGLDGCQHMTDRAVVTVVGQVVQLAVALVLVPHMQIIGLAWAQLAQSLFMVVVSWCVLRWRLPGLRLIPSRWDRSAFREMLAYGANIQLANASMLLFDPLTKVLMARFGGATSAGYFEMANQVIMKSRSLIISANQAVVPVVAQLAADGADRMHAMYCLNIRLVAFAVLPAFALLILSSGYFSVLLAGAYSAQFILFFRVSACAWSINVFAGPAYFMNMGAGTVGLNTVSHLAMGLLNLVLGYFMGRHFGPVGVLAGYAIALVSGSVWLVVLFQRRFGVRFKSLHAAEHLPLAAMALVVSLPGLLGARMVLGAGAAENMLAIFSFAMVLPLCFVLLRHPVAGRLMREVRG